MLLKAILDYLQLVGRASLQDLSRHFNVQESAMHQMMETWVRKQKVKIVEFAGSGCSSGKCSDCHVCDDSAKLIYIYNAS